MNARQKAKYYKKKYEELLKVPVKYTATTYKVDTIRFTRLYPEFLVTEDMAGYLRNTLKKDICNELVDTLGSYVDVQMNWDPHNNSYRVDAALDVVRKK